MQALFPEIRKFFCSFSPFSKAVLRAGMPFVLGFFAAALTGRLLLGHCGDYDKLARITAELFLCGKELLGAVGVGALVVQLLLSADGYDRPPDR